MWVKRRACVRACGVTCQVLKHKSTANAPSLSSYSYIHEKINTLVLGRGGCWWREGCKQRVGTIMAHSWVALSLKWVSEWERKRERGRERAIEFCHLFGHWWTHLCSSASVAGPISAERRYTATQDHLGRAGQTGTYMCNKKKIKKLICGKELAQRTSDGRGDGSCCF